MEITNKFSLPRTISLVRKLLIENAKTNIMRLVVLFGSLILLAILIGYCQGYSRGYDGNFDRAIPTEQVAFTGMFFILGSIYVSTAFNSMIHKTGRISMLSLPANSSEKFIAHYVVYVIMFLVAFFCAIWVADWSRYFIMKIAYPECTIISTIKWHNIFNIDGSATIALCLIYQSFFFLGSIVWPRYSYIKTFLALTILFLLFAITCGICTAVLLPPSNHYNMSCIARFQPIHILWFVTVTVCLINYMLTYMRLRETEVINRF